VQHQRTILLHRTSGFSYTKSADERKRILAREADQELLYRLAARNFMVDSDRLAEVLDYVAYERTRVREEGEATFSVKGRTMEALLRQSTQWHQTTQKTKKVSQETWKNSEIAPYAYEGVNAEGIVIGPKITIHELVTVRDLQDEGRALHHCVSSYAYSCVNGHCSIWSLRMDGKRLVTLEMNQNKTIVQGRGLCNRSMTANEKTHILAWGKTTGVHLSGIL
jgi:hypothetical protein